MRQPISTSRADERAVPDPSPAPISVGRSGDGTISTSGLATTETTLDRPIETDRPNAEEIAEAAPPEYSLTLVRQLFLEFSHTGRAPRCPPTIELARLVYGRAHAPAEIGGPARHVLVDTSRGGEFIRFSRPNAADGLVFPNPEAHYAPVMRNLFPTLAREDYGSPSALSAIEPVRVQRRADSQWEVG
jgi:hypothetical protein